MRKDLRVSSIRGKGECGTLLGGYCQFMQAVLDPLGQPDPVFDIAFRKKRRAHRNLMPGTANCSEPLPPASLPLHSSQRLVCDFVLLQRHVDLPQARHLSTIS